MTILEKNDEYRHAKENFKIHSGADLILFGIPVVAGIVSINNVPLQNAATQMDCECGYHHCMLRPQRVGEKPDNRHGVARRSGTTPERD